jgi:mono/diheme cytochrome c family protein
MKLRKLFIAVLLSVPMPAFADGAELYGSFCSGCHGQDAEQISGFAGSAERFREILEGDTEDMPDFYGTFEPAEVSDLYEYVIMNTRQVQE